MELARYDDSHLPRGYSLVSSFLEGLKASTMEAYAKDLEHFRRFVQAPTVDAAAKVLLGHGRGAANMLARKYMADMRRRLSPATVNRRLCALRAMVNVAEEHGIVDWTLKVKGPKVKSYRDTKGPGVNAIQSMLNEVAKGRPAQAARDVAILRMLFDLGLRTSELVGISLRDIEPGTGRAWILGKGREQQESHTLPGVTLAAVETWLAHRGRGAGALFTTYARTPEAGGGHLSDNGLYRMIRRLGEKVGVQARPHGVRHSSITSALDVMGGDVRTVQKFSRHANVNTLLVYDDARQDLAFVVAEAVAGALETPELGTEDPVDGVAPTG